jgi:hypothetical protein
MRCAIFAAIAAAGALASGAPAQGQQRPGAERDLVIVDRAAEAHTSENRASATGPADACPEPRAPDDYLFIYCSAEVTPQMAEERTMAQAPDGVCKLPCEPWGIPAALDAAISGAADKDRACMKTLLIPEAHLIFASVGADGTPNYRFQTLDDWIARTKSRSHVLLEEKQLNFRLETEEAIAHLWSFYVLRSDGKAVARGINSIQAIKEASGWRVASIMVEAESASAPLLDKYLP